MPSGHSAAARVASRPFRRLSRGDGRCRTEGIRMKIAVVGGGSTYTPELIDGFARLADQVKITEVLLVDPAPSGLRGVRPFSAPVVLRHGHRGDARGSA